MCNFELIQLVKNGPKINFLENVIKYIKRSFNVYLIEIIH